MAISNRLPAIDVEYDKNSKRATKHFSDAYKARRFYVAKLNAGKNPVLTKPKGNATD